MFGVVPKVLWNRKHEADDRNRILLATRTLLAIDRSAKRVILVDTGTGTKWDTESAARYGVDHEGLTIKSTLERLGLAGEDVTDVVITHLHFDHNGGLTDWADQPGGATRVCYPQARHWVHRDHWDHALNPTLKDRASFWKQDFEALKEAGVLQFVEGTKPRAPFDGVEWTVSQGHTRAQLLPLFTADDRPMLFAGDLIPTASHLPPAWVMAYDLLPLVTIEEKQAVLRRCGQDGLRLAFPHDPQTPGVELDSSSHKPAVASVLDL